MKQKQHSRTVRKMQAITPYGVGAIFDYSNESFVGMDISRWKADRKVELIRLSRNLRVSSLREPPAGGIPYMRFPRWLHCSTCGRMVYLERQEGEEGPDAPTCPYQGCQGTLIPMRFVVACAEGHLDDVPWSEWVHGAPGRRLRDPADRCASQELSFETRSGLGGGLESLYVKCRRCSAERSLSELMGGDGVGKLRCRGGQPWYGKEARVTCTSPLRAVLRGATNLYSARLASALDIPPESDYDVAGADAAEIRVMDGFASLADFDPGDPLLLRMARIIARKLVADDHPDYDAEVRRKTDLVLAMARAEGSAAPPPSTDQEQDLLVGEWHALTQPRTHGHHPLDRFQTEASSLLPPDEVAPPSSALELLNRLIGQVVLVHRLREVRALTGFTRLEGTGIQGVMRPDRLADYMPAIEVHGEGIFFTISEPALAQWQAAHAEPVAGRVALLAGRTASTSGELAETPVTARLLALHTLSHLLIRQLAFEAGYSSSALRERLYVSDGQDGQPPMAGVLIYTADGDQEGTLGGLVRLGKPGRFSETLLAALAAAQWCSSDPVCGESRGQGTLGLNLAACHACALVAETSCTHRNLFLDRALLLGTPGWPHGLFGGVLQLATSEYTGAE